MRAVIADDERLARKELKSLLSEYENIEIIGECTNGDEAIEFINKNHPDVVFLDIEMPEKNGFDVVKEISKSTAVVFITAYNDYALKAFEVNAMDYLVKPVDPERLKETIDKLEEDNKPIETKEYERSILYADDRIFIKDGEKCWLIKTADIRLFESEGNYVRVYFNDFKPLILKSLNNLEKKLDNTLFFRANRKFILNLNEIVHIENWFNNGLQATLKDGKKIEISRRQAVKFKAMMSI